jgi:transposase-like protein
LAARPSRHAPGDRWFVDETYIKVAGQWTYLYRAIDQHGQVIDVLLSLRRDLAAANNPIEADHGRLRRGHYDITTEIPSPRRLRIAFDDLALTI